MPMGNIGEKLRLVSAGAVSLSTTTDNILNWVGPIRIHRVGVHCTVAKTTGTAGVVSLQSVAGVTETAVGTVTTPDTMAAGSTYYKEFNPPLSIAAGARFKAEVTTAANAGSGVVFAEYYEDPLTVTNTASFGALT